MKLKKKKTIVTGAGRSIGKAIALAFAEQGADVLISYRSNQKGAEETAEEIQKLGRLGKALHANFSETKEVDTFFDKALKLLNGVDVLVNCAGEYDTNSFFSLGVDKFELLLKVGVLAPMRLIQRSSKHMIDEQKPGNIINISSISGCRPYRHRVAHSTAKAALNMLTQSTALELAPHHIRVNAIAPGYVPYTQDVDPTLVKKIPLGRSGLVEDQAKAAVYLASQESSWMTGQILVVDGGQSLSFV